MFGLNNSLKLITKFQTPNCFYCLKPRINSNWCAKNINAEPNPIQILYLNSIFIISYTNLCRAQLLNIILILIHPFLILQRHLYHKTIIALS